MINIIKIFLNTKKKKSSIYDLNSIQENSFTGPHREEWYNKGYGICKLEVNSKLFYTFFKINYI